MSPLLQKVGAAGEGKGKGKKKKKKDVHCAEPFLTQAEVLLTGEETEAQREQWS